MSEIPSTPAAHSRSTDDYDAVLLGRMKQLCLQLIQKSKAIQTNEPDFFKYRQRLFFFLVREFKRFHAHYRYDRIQRLQEEIRSINENYAAFSDLSRTLCERDLHKKEVEHCMRIFQNFTTITAHFFLSISKNHKPLNTPEISLIEQVHDVNKLLCGALDSFLKKL